MSDLYACECQALHLPNLIDTPLQVDGWLENLVKDIYRKKGFDYTKADPEITKYYAKTMLKGVGEGMGASVDWNRPDSEMIRSLQKNVYQFSAAKTYQQGKALSQALVDGDKVRSWEDFRKAAYAINADHKERYLRAEYEQAIASGQMASKWEYAQQHKEQFPNMQFDAVMDARTTSLCRGLDGVIKSVDDAFWDTYYPPNHWGCRSTVRHVGESRETPGNQIEYPDKLPTMFQTNLAKTGVVYPPAHPYWDGLPEKVKQDALKLLPYNEQFVKLEGKGGRVRQHVTVKPTGDDYTVVKKVAEEKAAIGQRVDIMPVLQEKDPARAIIYPDAKPGKNPDLRIEGRLAEVENSTKDRFNTIKHSVSAAAKQANHAIINLAASREFNINDLRRIAKGRFIDYPDLQVVEFRLNGEYLTLKRKDFFK